MKKRILCLEGGGAKGVSQCVTLKALEKEYGKPLHEVYDLISGSSVGSINGAIGATGGYSMSYLAKIYPEMLKKVFKKKHLFRKPKYDFNNFRKEWQNLFGNDFRMSDCKTKLMLTSIDRVTDINHFFKSWDVKDCDKQLVDIVCRSFAAPIYFGQINDYERKSCWVDGGCGNSNLPLDEVKTQAELFGWYDMPGKGDNEIFIDVVGCLFSNPHHTFENVSKDRWFKQIMDVINPKSGGMARAQSRVNQIRKLTALALNNKNIRFRYWDYEIPEKFDKLDGIEYVKEYEKFGNLMAEKPLIDLS